MLSDIFIEIAPESWRTWKEHPTTKEVFRVLQAELEVWGTRLLEGDTLVAPDRALIDTARTAGIVRGLRFILQDLELELREQWQRREEERNEE